MGKLFPDYDEKAAIEAKERGQVYHVPTRAERTPLPPVPKTWPNDYPPGLPYGLAVKYDGLIAWLMSPEGGDWDLHEAEGAAFLFWPQLGLHDAPDSIPSAAAPVVEGKDWAKFDAERDAGGHAASVTALMDKWDKVGVSSHISEHGDVITLHKVVVPESQRNTGVGTQFMHELTAYADHAGKTIALTPDRSFGGAKGRLEEFYKRFGFVANKGRSRDLSISETMIRPPA